MNLKFLSFTIIIFNIYTGSCSGVEPYLSNKDVNTKELRVIDSDPVKRELFLGFLGSIFKPIIRGIADVVAPPDPPPPPPPPQIIMQPHPQASPTVPTATIEPDKKEVSKPDNKDKDNKKNNKDKKDKDSEDSETEEEVDNGFSEDDDEQEGDEDDDEED